MTSSRVLVVGAGISGLTLANSLRAANVQVTICDAASRAGGWVSTKKFPGHIVEEGPRAFTYRDGEATLDLIDELNLRDQVVLASPNARHRWIFHPESKTSCRLPSSLFKALGSPLTKKAFWGIAAEPFRPQKVFQTGEVEDETIESFVQRRLGRDALANLLDPLVAGIYAGKPSELSMRSCFPPIWEMEHQYGSIIKGSIKKALNNRKNKQVIDPWRKQVQRAVMFTFKDGMQTLTDRLLELRQSDSDVRLGSPLVALRPKSTGVEVDINGKVEQFDHVFSTVSAPCLSSILQKDTGASDGAAKTLEQALRSLPHGTVSGVNLVYSDPLLPIPGFGVLIPSRSSIDCLGVIFDSSTFPTLSESRATTRLTVMMGGTRHPELNHLSPDQLVAKAKEHVQQLLNIYDEPAVAHPWFARNCIPQYDVGHYQRVEKIHQTAGEWGQGHLTVLGTSVARVGVNHCVANARKVAHDYLAAAAAAT